VSDPTLSDPIDRYGYWPAFALLAALASALALGYRYLPLLDWPQHCASAAVVEHLRDPAFSAGRYYELVAAPR
jgi:hypothetical protein